MSDYLINEVRSGMAGPSSNVRVTAEKYEEKGSFTVFTDENGREVFAMQTEKIRTIKTLD